MGRKLLWIVALACAIGLLVLGIVSAARSATIPLGIDRGGTGPYFLVNSTKGTWHTAQATIDLSKIDAQVPSNQPVPYIFLGMHGSSGWNAESGVFFQNGRWHPFTFRAPGVINGQSFNRWYQPGGPGYDASHTLTLSFKTNNGTFTSTVYDETTGQGQSWTLSAADGAGYSNTGTNQFAYRELALNTFENQWSASGFNAKYWGAEYFDSALCNNSGCTPWGNSLISNTSAYWPGDTNILDQWWSEDGTSNGADFSAGIYRGLAPGPPTPEPESWLMLASGALIVIVWSRRKGRSV